ncbi:MAG: hypothetical protein NTW86_30645 [Candidatus Sumerlaeota bacterium]|nr:hypothetical protein [Candidatus Sumerlaeota bacterium]
MDYDATAGAFSGQITPAMSLAGSGSNNLDNSVKRQTVTVDNFRYRVEYGIGDYSCWVYVDGGAAHSVALLAAGTVG